MKKIYKAVIDIGGKKSELICSSDTVTDGQKVMLVRKTGERIKGRVSGRDLGNKEVVIGVGRVQNGKISFVTENMPISGEIQALKRGIASINLGSCSSQYKAVRVRGKNHSDSTGGLRLKAIKD